MAPVNLHEIKLEDIDFNVVKDCTDQRVLKRYIKLLEDDGYFHELLRACRDKLLEVAPKDYYKLYPPQTTPEECDEVQKELLEWQDNIMDTDNALRNATKNRIWESSEGPVPVRGRAPIVIPRPLSKPTTAAERPAKTEEKLMRDKRSVKDYYSAWDALDVDVLEKKIDEEEEEEKRVKQLHFEDLTHQQREAHATTDLIADPDLEKIPVAHRAHMSSAEKDKGNEAFYSKDYAEAEVYYTRSIEFRPDDKTTWANRALVRLKMKKAQEAFQDTQHALALDPLYVKALHRQGKALHDLGEYEAAVHSFQLALRESPGNTQINGDLMFARRKMRSDGASSGCANVVPCQIKDTAENSDLGEESRQKGFARIVIEEDSDEDTDTEEVSDGVLRVHEVSEDAHIQEVSIQDVSESAHCVQEIVHEKVGTLDEAKKVSESACPMHGIVQERADTPDEVEEVSKGAHCVQDLVHETDDACDRVQIRSVAFDAMD